MRRERAMRNTHRSANRSRGRKVSSFHSLVVMALAVTLLLGGAIGGTLAWLIAEPQEVVNTFVAGQIGTLTLTETDTDAEAEGVQHQYPIIPGVNITKDPKVTYTPVTGDGIVPVNAYVFVELTGIDHWELSSTSLSDAYEYNLYRLDSREPLMAFGIDKTQWTKVEGVSGTVFYKEVSADDNNFKEVSIIKNDTILVFDRITKDEIEDDVASRAGNLTFKAYAIQQADGGSDNDGKFTPAEAWEKVK